MRLLPRAPRIRSRMPAPERSGLRKVVFQSPGQIGVPGTGRCDSFMFCGIARFDRQRFFPVLPVFILQDYRDRRTDGCAVAHARKDVGLVGSIFMRPPRP